MSSHSETSSTGICQDTATQAQHRTTQLAALLATDAGKALLQRHLSPHTTIATAAQEVMDDPAAKAQRQTAQLAALLSTEPGKLLMQQHISDFLRRKQQQQRQQAAAQPCAELPAAVAAPQQAEGVCALAELHPRVLSTAIAVSRTQPGSAERAAGLALLKLELMQHASLSTAVALANAGSNPKLAAAAAAAFNKACSPEPATTPTNVAAAAAASDQQPGRQDLNRMLSLLMGKAAAAGAADSAAAAAAANLVQQQLQQQAEREEEELRAACMQIQHDEAEQQQAAASPSTGSMAAEGEPLTCAMAWSLLQQKQQQQQQQQADEATAAAVNLGLMRHGTFESVQSMQSMQALRQDSADPASLQMAAAAAAGQHSPQQQAVNRTSSQQVVFKRRANNSTALRKHFSGANNATRSDSGTFNKPQQVFKKQRKRPLMLWPSNSNVSQQMQAYKQQPAQQQQGQGQMPPASHPAEPEYSSATASSGATGSAYHAALDACAQLSPGAAALPPLAARGAPAAPSPPPCSGVESVLNTLARQEQQLLILQQQLRQQRELITARRQAKQAEAAPAPEPAVAAAAPVNGLELLLRVQAAQAAAAAAAAPAPAVAADVDMPDVWQQAAAVNSPAVQQQQGQAGVAPEAITALMSLANALAGQQPAADVGVHRSAAAPMQQGWDTDILRKLTAALLAA